MGLFIPERIAGRAATNCAPGAGGCLISRYSTGSHGYAQLGWHQEDGRRVATTAHRAAWVAANGRQIPDGMTVDHTCHVRQCVNPEHLRLLDNVENARDNRTEDSFTAPPVVLLGRRCRNGHQLLGFPTGQVTCRPCETERGRKKYPKRNARRYPRTAA